MVHEALCVSKATMPRRNSRGRSCGPRLDNRRVARATVPRECLAAQRLQRRLLAPRQHLGLLLCARCAAAALPPVVAVAGATRGRLLLLLWLRLSGGRATAGAAAARGGVVVQAR